MTSKIMQVFYGNDCLPYKYKDRTVHYPIVGNAFNGASNTTQIRFYVDQIGGTESVSWVVLGKLPNGKPTYQVLSNIQYDNELNEWYVAFYLSNYYTQYKGDVYFFLNGYNGNIQVEEDEDTGIYTIHGTPTIQATGAIKLAINYAPQLPLGTQVPMSDLDQLIALISNKVNIKDAIVVFNDIANSDLSSYDICQLFYDKTTKQYYKKTNYGYELVEDGAGILGKKYIDDKYDFILSAFSNIVENFVNDNVLYVKGEVDGTTLTMEVGTVSGNTYYLETSYIFYSKEEIDAILEDYVTNSGLATTLEDYYTKTQVDNFLGDKVDKTSSGYKIYATDELGAQTTLPYDEDTEGKVVRRDENGHVYVQNPSANGQATPKQYVDNGLALKADKSNTYTKSEVESIVATLKANSYIKINTTTYPTLQDFLDDYTGQEEGHIYLYPIDANDLTKGYYQYIWESNTWLDIGTTQIDLSDYVTLSTNQTITGTKTFEGDLKVKGNGTTTVGQITTTNYALKLGFGGINHITIGSNNFYTNVADYDLGSNSNKWRDAYISRYLTDGTYTITVANIVATGSLLASDSDIVDIMGD